MRSARYVARCTFRCAVCCILLIGFSRAQDIIAPAEDCVVFTFGGGQGSNTFLKYNISTVPINMSIDSVFLTPFVMFIESGWDYDMKFWNVNDQTWTEADSCRFIWTLPTSDTILQISGFGSALGWTKSVDLRTIFLRDYDVSNTYCSIKMKDPDDVTFNPMPGSYPVNTETLSVGNDLGNQQVLFYAHEYPNAPPWMLIYYHPVGINDYTGNECDINLNITPNPVRKIALINLNTPRPADQLYLAIYNCSGQFVKRLKPQDCVIWDVTDNNSNRVPAGIYYCVYKNGERVSIKSVCVL